jgi:hypothetical protein
MVPAFLPPRGAPGPRKKKPLPARETARPKIAGDVYRLYVTVPKAASVAEIWLVVWSTVMVV